MAQSVTLCQIMQAGPDSLNFCPSHVLTKSCPVQVAHNYSRQDQLFHMVLHLPMALAAVSEAVQAILLQVRPPPARFAIACPLCPCSAQICNLAAPGTPDT